ncbi:MAG: YgiQ family radical SAM protein [Candidatus Omnitrophica bacterium]|nr:YgiQ family radical SAM protein [Candidatus Omnitrophota bacterium]
MNKNFLPTSKEEMQERGWSALDVIIVTGDAYVDHASYGASVIGRMLEAEGFKVGIIAQPRWQSAEDFKKLGRPRLFFGVTAGNLDSMVANYTANKAPRRKDGYSPGGKPGLRPDRATIVYTNRIREAFGQVPIVLGGIEASLRRLAHYDYWSDKLRRSALLDSKADILIYGMGEKQAVEIAKRLAAGEDIRSIDDIRGTAVIKNDVSELKRRVMLPSFEEVSQDKEAFIEAFRSIHENADPAKAMTLVQKHGERFIVQLPPSFPLTTEELDRIYLLDYARDWHPSYDKEGGVPGFETVRFSIISHRGCCGGCSFCSLYAHQGRIIQSRSEASILKEAARIAVDKDFKGTITDVGGPTANLYRAECGLWEKSGACKEKQCLTPEKCKDLKLGYGESIQLLRKLRAIPKVRHVFIGSGVRYDLLLEASSDAYLRELCAHNISGQLKVAPEHIALPVLKLMNKPSVKKYEEFVRRFDAVNKRLRKKQFLVNYFLSSHPGSGLNEALQLALYLAEHGIHPEQIQDFMPLPMTVSAVMYYTGKDPLTGKSVYVMKGLRDRKTQRAMIQYRQPQNKKLVLEALKKLNKRHLKGKFFA